MEIVQGITIQFVLFCAMLGAFGQLVRSVIGVYKIHKDANQTFTNNFDYRRLIVSLVMGALIGMIVSLIYKSPLSSTDILGIVASSYAGTDWLEGFLAKKTTNG